MLLAATSLLLLAPLSFFISLDISTFSSLFCLQSDVALGSEAPEAHYLTPCTPARSGGASGNLEEGNSAASTRKMLDIHMQSVIL